MHPAISSSYILPALFLNPVVFLHGLNTIISRLLPPIIVSTAPVQRPAYSLLGPAATHPHIDVQNSENLCWSYTAVMICAQLVAYGRVMKFREAGKEKQRRKEEMNGANGHVKHSESYWEEENSGYSDGNSEKGDTNGYLRRIGKGEESDISTEDSEIIL